MVRHKIDFSYTGTEDDASINLAFSKKKVEERKEWLSNWMEERKRRTEMGLPEVRQNKVCFLFCVTGRGLFFFVFSRAKFGPIPGWGFFFLFSVAKFGPIRNGI